MLSQYLLFTVIKKWLPNTLVSAYVLKVYDLGKFRQEAIFADNLISVYGQFDVSGKTSLKGHVYGDRVLSALLLV